MTEQQIADARAYLAQRMSIKVVAATAGVSEWQVVGLIGRGRV